MASLAAQYRTKIGVGFFVSLHLIFDLLVWYLHTHMDGCVRVCVSNLQSKSIDMGALNDFFAAYDIMY